ncbi:MAG: hypothetical protein JWQ29_2478 [Phenylobacterium sp.]|nr:hypothetical protein [Phenylobacterium sp.]
MPAAGENELSAMTKDPERLIRLPIGAVSPLWGLFAGAAVSGAAWWWMTRWARPANLEAAFGAAEGAVSEVEAQAEALAAPLVDAVEEAPAVIEAAAEPVLEVVAEAPPPPAAELLIEAAPEPVGGESAPISPVLEALSLEIAEPAPAPPEAESAPMVEAAAAPKAAPRPKKAAPKAD